MSLELLILTIIIIVGLLIDAILIVFVKLFVQTKPTTIKMMRYEAGNPPLGQFRYVLPMQYFGYLFMFVALEPLFALILVLSVSTFSLPYALSLLILIATCVVVLVPLLYVAYRFSIEIAYMFEKKVKR